MVFRHLTKKYLKGKSSEFVFLGAAEAEALPTSSMPLSKVYVDHHNLMSSL